MNILDCLIVMRACTLPFSQRNKRIFVDLKGSQNLMGDDARAAITKATIETGKKVYSVCEGSVTFRGTEN